MWTIQSNARISLYEKFHNFSVFAFFFYFQEKQKQLLAAQLYYMVSLCARGDLNPLWGYRDLHYTKRPEYSRRPLNKMEIR